MRARFLNAGPLLRVAKTAYERIPADVSDKTPGQPDSLVALIFAAAAAEAFINEMAELAEDPWQHPLPGGH